MCIVLAIVVVLLYLAVRLILAESSTGITHFKPEYCYDVMGVTSDPHYLQSKCWAQLVQKQLGHTLAQAKFNFWGPRTQRDFLIKLKEIQQVSFSIVVF